MADFNMEHTPRTGDDADIASVNTENDLKLALYRRKIDQQKYERPHTGFCMFCACQIDEGRFCLRDGDWSCSEEFEKEAAAKIRNHGQR